MSTFVVRIYSDADGELHGAVDEISTGKRATFGDPGQLLRILARGRVDDSSGLAEGEARDGDV